MSRPTKILLVDDEPRFIKSLSSILKHYKFDCTEALSGSEAIKLINKIDFDLALLDVGLPDMQGCDILDYIKKSQKHITSIMLTGISTVETAVAAMKLGAYDFLNKPINHELLLKTINKAIEHNELSLELQGSERKFQALAEATSEAIVIHNDGQFIEANKQFFALFGYSSRELIQGKFLKKIITPLSLQAVLENSKESSHGKHEAVGIKKDGTVFPIEATVRSINYLGKNAIVCAIRDLSERIKAEEEKFELYKKLEHANKLKALGLMAGSVAHDLNNILVGVVSYPDLLLSQIEKTSKIYPQIKKIQDSGKRAVAVVSDLVTIARGGTFTTTIENINDVILTHLDSIEHRSRLTNYPTVILETKLQMDLFNSHCSPQHIHKIFLNLIGNALEAVKDNGVIRITTENCKFIHPLSKSRITPPPEDYIKICISDNGPGIPQKDLDHIFEPFYSTKIMGMSGTGLGLSIVWNTVQEHNGWIEVKNLYPGVTFEIYLPATHQECPKTTDETECAEKKGHGETILIIDDQIDQIETMKNMLDCLGYKTYAVKSGEEGIEFVRTQTVDLVLLDMIMGDGLNGCETFRKILQIQPKQKSIIISGYSTTEHMFTARDLGVSQFLAKPVSMSTLNAAINKTLYAN